MKKAVIIIIIAVIVVAAIIVGIVTVCKKKENENITSGGWGKVSSPIITDELKTVFGKAVMNTTGLTAEPIAYLEMQVVGGFNHLVLCKYGNGVENPQYNYGLAYIYERPSGNAEFTKIIGSGVPAPGREAIPGGWAETDDPTVPDNVKKDIEKINKTLTGAQLSPVAVLASQVVAGTNYEVLCEMTATVPNAVPEYVIAHIYEDLQGNATLTDTANFNEYPFETPTVAEEQTDTTNSNGN